MSRIGARLKRLEAAAHDGPAGEGPPIVNFYLPYNPRDSRPPGRYPDPLVPGLTLLIYDSEDPACPYAPPPPEPLPAEVQAHIDAVRRAAGG